MTAICDKKFVTGDSFSIRKEITEEEILSFADISGDHNPLHIDRDVAERSVFGKQVAHGALVSSYISAVIGMRLPGPGTIYLEQKCSFLKPVFIGDSIIVTVTIKEIDQNRNAVLDTVVKNQNGVTVLEGYAKVRLPKAETI